MTSSQEFARRSGPLAGAIAAAVTPFTPGGEELDLTAVGPLVELYASSGLQGVMLGGSTGEGILLSVAERCQLTEAFQREALGRLKVVVHAGAQTTRDTRLIAEHARDVRADAVSVIAPPYFRLDNVALLTHLVAAAKACSPTPFYIYEFMDRSGYAVPIDVLEQLGLACENFMGLKVSDAPFERFKPYLVPWLDILVGPESLISVGYSHGAVGAVSALASAFPELIASLVADPTEDNADRITRLRVLMEKQPLHASLKAVLRSRGVPINEDVRGPLRALTDAERADVLEGVSQFHGQG